MNTPTTPVGALLALREDIRVAIANTEADMHALSERLRGLRDKEHYLTVLMINAHFTSDPKDS